MDRNRGGDRSHGGSSNNGYSRRPSRFTEGSNSRFPDCPPSSRFSDAPHNRLFNNGHGGYGRRSPNNYRGRDAGRRAFESPPHLGPGGVGFRSMGNDDGGSFRPPVGGYGHNIPGPPAPFQPPLSGQKRSYGNRGGSPERSDGVSFAKLFVGSVPRTASEGDIRPLFEEYGNVLEVALIRDKRTGQQQGCCFIKFSTSEEADKAIKGLHNQRTLPGGAGPIQVRYADGERERLGAVEHKLFVGSLDKQASVKEIEEIFSPYGQVEDVYLMRDEMKQSRGCGFVKYAHRDMAMAAINALNGIYRMRGCDQPLTVRFADPKRPRSAAVDLRGPPPNPPFLGPAVTSQLQARGPRVVPKFGEPIGDGVLPNAWNPVSPPNCAPRGFGSHFPRHGDLPIPFNQSLVATNAYQKSPTGKPLHSPQPPPALKPHGPASSHHGQLPFIQPQPGFHKDVPTPAAVQSVPVANQLPFPAAAQPPRTQALQQPPSHLAQLLSQQTQTLQASFQSSQQAFSQLQQQVQMMQPANQSAPPQQAPQATKPQWTAMPPQMSATHTSIPPDAPSSAGPPPAAPAKTCWTEHTSPEGYKYYYNSITRESKWEKPDELLASEQQNKPSNHQMLPPQQSLQPLPKFPAHFRYPHLPHPSQPPVEANYTQLPLPPNSFHDPVRPQVNQDWMWKNKPAG